SRPDPRPPAARYRRCCLRRTSPDRTGGRRGTAGTGAMTGLVDADRPLHENFDCALLDLDGVVYRGADAVPHAAGVIGTIRRHGMGTVFVTNNASRTPEDIADHLTELGVPTGPEEVT